MWFLCARFVPPFLKLDRQLKLYRVYRKQSVYFSLALLVFAYCVYTWLTFAQGGMMCLGMLLAHIAYQDVKHYRIPQASLLLFVLGSLCLSAYWSMAEAHTHPAHIFHVFYSLFIFVVLSLSIRFCGTYLTGKEVLGWGDVKLFAASALWVPIMHIPLFLFSVGLLGTVLALYWEKRWRTPYIPLGAAIAANLALWLVWQTAGG